MKILILYSGGLDSLAMLKYFEANYGTEDELILLYYDIGHGYNYKELEVVPENIIVKKIDWLGGCTGVGKEDGTQSGDIFIPGRNLAFITLAACQYLPDQIWLGALEGEIHERATDKNFTFLSKLEDMLGYTLKPFYPNSNVTGPRLRFPLAEAGMCKVKATQFLLDQGVSKEEIMSTSSCLSAEQGNCGHCVVCFRRWGIFAQLGMEEIYNVDPLTVEANKEMVIDMLTGSSKYDSFRYSELLPTVLKHYEDVHGKEHIDVNQIQNVIRFIKEY